MSFLIESFFIKENSVRNIINVLGYPNDIANIIQDIFGKNSFIIAKWLKDYKTLGRDLKEDDDWFRISFHSFFSRDMTLVDLLDMLKASNGSLEDYKDFLKKNELYIDNDELAIIFSDDYELYKLKKAIIDEIKDKFLDDIFFSNTFISSIKSGELKDLGPYKKLGFSDALEKFRSKKVFDDKAIIKKYDDGYTWRNVGKKCEMTAKSMKNCGSAGVMSQDPDKTLLVLFDENNKPHAIVTYSPNDGRISSEEGVGSTELKSKYHDYVLDLAEHLGVRFDTERSKSYDLRTKYTFKDVIDANSLQIINDDTITDSLSTFTVNGERYYAGTRNVVSESTVNDYIDFIKDNSEKFESYIKNDDEQSRLNSILRLILSGTFDYMFPSNLTDKKIFYKDFINQKLNNIEESFSILKEFFLL